MIPRPCIRCGETGPWRQRCPRCEATLQALRNSDPKRRAYLDPAYRAIPLGGLCHLCGKPGADTRDHYPVSLEDGGTNHPSNVKPAHRACNSAAGRH